MSETTRLVHEADGKFWEAHVDGETLHVRFGKVGSKGQTRATKLASPAAAEKELARRIAEKEREGYARSAAGEVAAPEPSRAAAEPAPPPPELQAVPRAILSWFLKRYPEERDLGDFERMTGCAAPADLRRLGLPDAGTPVFLESFATLAAVQGNVFEHILEKVDPGIPAAPRQLFANCFPAGDLLGEPPNGDHLFVHVQAKPGLPALVSRWSHEENLFEEPCALDLASAAWCHDASEEYDRTGDAARFARRLKSAAGRVGFSSLLLLDDDVPELEEARDAGLSRPEGMLPIGPYVRRAEWIIEALTTGELHPNLLPDNVLELGKNPKALGHAAFAAFMPIGLYWLWRSFLLGEEETLATSLRLLEGSPSRILRDAAGLVRELERGRNQVGKIRDVRALQERTRHEVPAILEGRRRAAEEKKRARLLASLRGENGVALEPADPPPAEAWQPVRKTAAGGALRADAEGLHHAPAGEPSRLLVPWPPTGDGPSEITWWSLHPSGDRVIVPALQEGWSQCYERKSDAVELELASGRRARVLGDVFSACYLRDGRIVIHHHSKERGFQLISFLVEEGGAGGRTWRHVEGKSPQGGVGVFLDELPGGILPSFARGSLYLWRLVEGGFERLALFHSSEEFTIHRAAVVGGEVRLETSLGPMRVTGLPRE